MVMKFMEGDTAGAAKIQIDAIPLINALFCEVNPIPVKTALNLMGMNVGLFVCLFVKWKKAIKKP